MTPEDKAALESPHTTAAQLRTLAEKYRQQGKHYIARHPNTPVDILQGLFYSYPNAVFENPALPLILIEDTNFWRNIAPEKLIQVLREPKCPSYLIAFWANHPDLEVKTTASHHRSLGEAKDGWEKEILPDIAALESQYGERRCLTECDMIPEWLENVLPPLLRSEKEVLPIQYDTRPLTEEERAEREKFTANQWWELLQYSNRIADYEFVLEANSRHLFDVIAQNPNTPVGILRQISHKDQEGYHNQFLLQNPNTPADVLCRFAKMSRPQYYMSHEDCMRRIFNHNNTPQDVWENLIPMLSPTMKLRPSRYPLQKFTDAFHHIPENLKTPGKAKALWDYQLIIGQRILHRRDADVSFRRQILSLSYNILETPFARFISLSQLKHEHPLPWKKARIKSWWVRFALAINPHTEKEILENLLQDADRYVVAAAKARLENPNWRFEDGL
jgi:hypothetical protein